MLISFGVFQDTREQESVNLPMRFRIQVVSVGPEPLADECSQPEVVVRRRNSAADARLARKLRQKGWQQDGTTGLQQCLLQNTLQLADVARPRVGSQLLQCLGRQFMNFPAKFAAESSQAMPHQQRQIVLPLAQRRKMNRE